MGVKRETQGGSVPGDEFLFQAHLIRQKKNKTKKNEKQVKEIETWRNDGSTEILFSDIL